MPHLTLEYTAGLRPDIEFEGLFARLHDVLSDVAGIKKGNCKSRAIKLDRYLVGDGTSGEGFVHLDARFLEGRPLELKEEIGLRLLAALKQSYESRVEEGDLQITVEIRDIERATYFKIPTGSLDYR
jgi:5-carboxymethyl-2-hydroxymuconate isomerase